MADPTDRERWEAFVHHWSRHHGVAMTDAARSALVRAMPPAEVFAAALTPLASEPAPRAGQQPLF